MAGMNRADDGIKFPAAIVCLAALLACTLLAGCSAGGPVRNGRVTMVHGTARVLTVNPYLKSAVVRYDGQTRNAWWNRYSILYFGGQVANTLDIHPGQKIHFDGLLADGDVYFGRAWRNTAPPPLVYPPSQIVHPNGLKPKKKMRLHKMPASPGVPGLPGLRRYLKIHLHP